MKAENNILIRCDASEKIGAGHLIRCIAFAQALKKAKFIPIFACRKLSGRYLRVLKKYKLKYFLINSNKIFGDLRKIKSVLIKKKIKHIIIDLANKKMCEKSNGLIKFLQSLKNFRISFFDGSENDCVSKKVALPVQDIIIPYPDAEKLKLKTTKNCQYLLGEKYFPASLELQKIIKQKTKRTKQSNLKNCLICLGGTKNKKIISAVLCAIQKMRTRKIKFRIIDSEAKRKKTYPNANIKIIPFNSEFYKLLLWADVCVIGSGLTRYETFLLKIPTLIISKNKKTKSVIKKFCERSKNQFINITSNNYKNKLKLKLINFLKNNTYLNNYRSCNSINLDANGSARILHRILNHN